METEAAEGTVAKNLEGTVVAMGRKVVHHLGETEEKMGRLELLLLEEIVVKILEEIEAVTGRKVLEVTKGTKVLEVKMGSCPQVGFEAMRAGLEVLQWMGFVLGVDPEVYSGLIVVENQLSLRLQYQRPQLAVKESQEFLARESLANHEKEIREFLVEN